MSTPLIALFIGVMIKSGQDAAAEVARQTADREQEQRVAAEKRQEQQARVDAEARARKDREAEAARLEEIRKIEARQRVELHELDYRRTREAAEVEQARADALQRARTEAERKDAVAALSRFMYERRARSVMLVSSLTRAGGNPSPALRSELVERKRAYDEAFVSWNTNIKANLFTARRVLDTKEYTFIEHAVEQSLTRGMFAPLDACLTKAYDAQAAGGDPGPILSACKASNLLQTSLDCGNEIADVLFKLSSRAIDVMFANRRVEDACVVPESRS